MIESQDRNPERAQADRLVAVGSDGPTRLPRTLAPAAALLLTIALTIASTVAAAPTEDGGQPIDRQLLDQLLGEPIDAEAERDLASPPSQPPASGDLQPAGGSGDSRDTQPAAPAPEKEPAAGAAPRAAGPLLEVARDMRHAQGRLAEADSGWQTQTVQEQIVAQLDKLIRRARSQCRQSAASPPAAQGVASRQPVPQPKPATQPSPGARPPNTKPVTNPNASPGHTTPRQPTPEEIRGVLQSLWGELPPADRQQMLELPVGELFLPGYELWIEQYFRCLADEGNGS